MATALRWGVLLAFACVLATNIVGMSAQAGAPWIGARLREAGNVVRAVEVDPLGPAGRAGLRSGDTILSVCGEAAIPEYFFADPDHISSWKGQDALLAFQGRCLGPKISLEWKARPPRFAILDAEPTGWRRSIWSGLGMVLVAWAFGLVGWRSWLGRDNLATRVNLVGGVCACLGLSQLAFYQTRDISIDPSAFGWMAALNYLGSQVIMFAGSSLALVLPQPLRRLRGVPWLMWMPWVACLVQVVLHYGRILSNPLWTTYVPEVGSMALASAIFAYRFVFEKDALARSQIKWIALSFLVGLLPLAAFTEIPLVMGKAPLVAERWSILFTGFIPLGFAFAITRYRLLDIGTLLDSFLVHLAVMLVMAGVEAVFWIWIDRRMFSDQNERRAFFVATMLFLVFLYAPVRAWIARVLAIVLGRSRPSAETALEGLLDRANLLGDPQAALEQSLAWIFRPGSIRRVRSGEGWDPALVDLASTGGCLGQELTGVPESDAADLWVPIREGGSVWAMVLVPDKGQAWRSADRDLARLVARAAEPLLESHGLKREREALQREMHDGLGNQLYGLNLLSQDARFVPAEILRGRMERIQSASQDAIDSLRTGLAILAEPTEAFGLALARFLLRAEDHLAAVGIRLETQVDDQVAELSLDGRHAFALLRAMQEALGNAARHSCAENVVVSVEAKGDRLLASLQDDGKGFDPTIDSYGQGLGNIQRRLQESGGSGRVESAPGRGVRVVLELPLQRRAP